MKAYDPNDLNAKPARRDAVGEQLRVAITFNRPGSQSGPTKFGARMSTDTVAEFIPDPAQADLALADLARRGFKLTGRGALSASMRCTRSEFEALFQTKLERMSAPGGSAAQFDSVLYPPEGAPWNPDLLASAPKALNSLAPKPVAAIKRHCGHLGTSRKPLLSAFSNEQLLLPARIVHS